MKPSLRAWQRMLLAGMSLLLALGTHAQAVLNLGLEPRANLSHPLLLWQRGRAPGARVQFDSLVRRQGRGSVRLTLAEEEERVFATLYTSSFPLDSVRGQLVKVSAWVRTRGFRGQVGVYAFAHASTSAGGTTDRAQAIDSLPTDTEWQQLELRLPVKAVAGGFGIGLRAHGSGQVWFDDVQVRPAGRLLREAPQPGTEALFLSIGEALTPNWDFERLPPRLAWPNPARATVTLDSTRAPHGRHYLRVARVGEAAGPVPAVYLGTVPLDSQLIGQSLRVAGYWRQAGSPGGPPPSFACSLLSTDQGSNYHNDSPTGWGTTGLLDLPPLPAPGTQWTAFAFTIPIPNDYSRLVALSLSLRLPTGTVELDHLLFTLNGQPYQPPGPPTPPAPTAAETTWLRTALHPLSLQAPATDFQDLAALGTWLGPARVVGLGDVTQGSHEVLVLKSRLVRYLVGQQRFTVLGLPIAPARVAALAAYLQTGQGDPARLLASLAPWDTAEMLDLVRWLRTFNQSHPAAPIALVGLDLPEPEDALAQVTRTLSPQDEFAQSRVRQIGELLAAIRQPSAAAVDLRRQPGQPQDSLLAPVRRLLGELAAGLDARAKLLRGHPMNLNALTYQRHCLRLLEQAATLRRLPPELADAYRAACQAENVPWLTQPPALGGPAPRLLIWAHNQQVATFNGPNDPSLGQWLRAGYGPGYVALALALGEGRYAAEQPGGLLTAAALEPAAPGSYEAWLRTGPAAFWLPLNKLELITGNAWLLQQQLLRDITRRATQHQFGVHNLSTEFDAVFFVRQSTPARPLP